MDQDDAAAKDDANPDGARWLVREQLIERLELEAAISSGCRTLLGCFVAFGLILVQIDLAVVGSDRFGLRSVYENAFNLTAVERIQTQDNLIEYLHGLSQASRNVQLLSSSYFVEHAQQQFVSGIVNFVEPTVLDAVGVHARVDSPSFTLTAWVGASDGNILRKPLDSDNTNSDGLSCWGWHHGETPRFDFGAHDYGRVEGRQETAKSGASITHDGKLHLEAVVVTPTHVTFYHDATILSRVAIDRPVTDCSGSMMIVGDYGLHAGEINFYPFEVSIASMDDIFNSGMTLESVANGKGIIPTPQTLLDYVSAKSQRSFQTAERDKKAADLKLEIANTIMQASSTITQAVCSGDAEQTGSAPPLPPVPTQPDCPAGAYGGCKVITGVVASKLVDPITAHSYYDMLPPGAFGNSSSMVSGQRVSISPDLQVRYDLASFPSTLNLSWTFSAWIKANFSEPSGYLVAKHPAHSGGRCWGFNIANRRVGLFNKGVVDGVTIQNNPIPFDTDISADFNLVNSPLLRHVVITVNHTGGNAAAVAAYVDGQLLGTSVQDNINGMDCATTETSYLGFAHRAPGINRYTGELQQLRIYPGVALTVAEVAALHMESTDPSSGAKLRECAFEDEGFDSTYLDIFGHDCAWFQTARAHNPHVCADPTVRTECPIACGSLRRCYQAVVSSTTAESTFVWERVMPIAAPKTNRHTVCLVNDSSVSAVQACTAGSFDTSLSSGDSEFLLNRLDFPVANLSDCTELQESISPYCAFKISSWNEQMLSEVTQNGFTISFWLKSNGAESLRDGMFKPTIQFYSSLAPSQPFLTMHFNGDLFTMAFMQNCHGTVSYDDIAVPGHAAGFEQGGWIRIAFSLSGWDVSAGRSRLVGFVNAGMNSDYTATGYCLPASGRFLTSITSSHKILMSPVEIRPAVPPKTLQTEYYNQRLAMQLKRGPVETDEKRLLNTIRYEHAPSYQLAGFLVAPPLVAQTRQQKTSTCASRLGTDTIESMYHRLLSGSLCKFPYQCSEDLMSTSLPLIACATNNSPETYFGVRAHDLAGQSLFVEFLVSITDVPVLVRDNQIFETANFIDQQTRTVVVTLTMISPQYATVSLVTVSADLGSMVSARYSITHIAPLQEKHIPAYVAVSGLMIMLSLCFIGYKLYIHKTLSRSSKYSIYAYLMTAEDILLAVAFIVYSVLRLRWALQSNTQVGALVGSAAAGEGLLGVPWSDPATPYSAKRDAYLQTVDQIQSVVEDENSLGTFSFFLCFVLIVHMLGASTMHPRLAMLVGTLVKALGEIAHYFYLMSMVFTCFVTSPDKHRTQHPNCHSVHVAAISIPPCHVMTC